MKKHTIINTLFLLSIIVSPAIASADDLGVTANITATAQVNASGTLRDVLKEKRDEMVQDRKDMRASTTAMRASTTAQIKAVRASTTAAFIQAAQAKRDQFKAQIASSTAIMKAKRAQFMIDLKAGLAKIKDTFKQARVTKAATNLQDLNVQITARASGNVDRIEAVDVAIESRANKFAAASTTADLANVRALIATAKTAVATARTAIAVQVAKVYPVTITTDAAAKAAVQAARNQMKIDIDAMHAKVKAARDAAKAAEAALKAIPKINVAVHATTTASTTNNIVPY